MARTPHRTASTSNKRSSTGLNTSRRKANSSVRVSIENKNKSREAKGNTGSSSSNTSASSSNGSIRGVLFKSATKTKLDFRRLVNFIRLQNSSKLCLPRLSFSRVVREISQEFGNFKYQSKAIMTLQEAAEYHLLRIFSCSNKIARHAKRATIRPEDMKLNAEIVEDNKQ